MDVSNIDFNSMDDLLNIIKLLNEDARLEFLAVVGALLEEGISAEEATDLVCELIEKNQVVQ